MANSAECVPHMLLSTGFFPAVGKGLKGEGGTAWHHSSLYRVPNLPDFVLWRAASMNVFSHSYLDPVDLPCS